MKRMTDDIPVTPEEDEMWETLPQKQGGFFIPSPSMLMAGAIVLLSISNVIFFKLWRNAIDEFAHYRAAVVAAQKQAEADADKARIESERITADVSNSWQAALDHARRHPVVRVLQSRCDLPQAGAISHAASGTDGATSQFTISAAECEAVANDAVIDATHILYLQDWIKRQHEASK